MYSVKKSGRASRASNQREYAYVDTHGCTYVGFSGALRAPLDKLIINCSLELLVFARRPDLLSFLEKAYNWNLIINYLSPRVQIFYVCKKTHDYLLMINYPGSRRILSFCGFKFLFSTPVHALQLITIPLHFVIFSQSTYIPTILLYPEPFCKMYKIIPNTVQSLTIPIIP